jgi:hypothetical protein
MKEKNKNMIYPKTIVLNCTPYDTPESRWRTPVDLLPVETHARRIVLRLPDACLMHLRCQLQPNGDVCQTHA